MSRGGLTGLFCILVLVLATTSCSAASSQAKYGPYHGRVVDMETNKPIAGVAVLAIWWEAVFNPVQGKQEFYDAKEAVTDVDGRFEISKLDAPFLKLGIQPAEIMFFAPGYLRNNSTTIQPGGELFVDPTVVKLQPGKTKQERIEFQAWIVPPIPHEKMPIFVRTLNKEIVSLGFKPLGKQEVSK